MQKMLGKKYRKMSKTVKRRKRENSRVRTAQPTEVLKLQLALHACATHTHTNTHTHTHTVDNSSCMNICTHTSRYLTLTYTWSHT